MKEDGTASVVAVCEECREKPSKYKCPGCSIRTCSLPCVNKHKHRTACSGKRNLLLPLPFDDNVLLSDYNMLEDVKRVAESAKRMRTSLCPYPSYARLPNFLRYLHTAARNRRTKLLFLPAGLSKRARNQSRYDFRTKLISWTIEWRFHSTDVVIYDHGILEDATLRSVIEKHLLPGPWNHQLRQFCCTQLDHLKFLIRKHHKGSESPYRELDVEAPIGQQLANLALLEYPVIHVLLPTQNNVFEICRDAHQVPRKRDARENSDHLPMKGVCFREEEVEAGHLESQIDDLNHHSRLAMENLDHKNTTPDESLPNRSLCDDGFPGSIIRESLTQEEMLDFDQGLIDAYSDLIAQMNPDDFLDLDDDYTGNVGVSAITEDVEEGEIF